MGRNYFNRRKNESIEDPHELLLSLVDFGSLDVEDALVACVAEMSDAECKRVLNSLSLPAPEDEVEDDEDDLDEVEIVDLEDDVEDDEDEVEDDVNDLEDEDDVNDLEDEDDVEDLDEDDEDATPELEARIRRLEKYFNY